MAKPATMAPIAWVNCQVTLGELQPWADNPRLSTKAQARRLLDSWQRFGQVQTIAIESKLDLLRSAILAINPAAFG
jgi:hypothetical protein